MGKQGISKGKAAQAHELWRIDDLTPYARNSRTHSAGQVAQIKASLQEFGMVGAIVVRDGVIAKGHGTLSAIRQLLDSGQSLYPAPGAKGGAQPYPDGFVPVINVSNWSEAQFRAFVIADNQLAMNAGWDAEMLAVELGELQAEEFDLDLLGFSADDLEKYLAEPEPPNTGGDDEQPPPEVQDVEISRPGNVWLLGPHRVMCGDSTSKADIAKLMNGKRAQLLHADPPYGMGKEGEGVANDNLYGGKLDKFQLAWWQAMEGFLSDDSSVYVWGWEHNLCLFYVSILMPLLAANKATHKNWLIWDKGTGQGMRQETLRRYPPVTEHCLFFTYGVEEYNTNADNYWEGWEPVRLQLVAAMEAQGWTVKDLNTITGTQMGGHWVTKSQWTFITAVNYEKLVAAAKKPEAFPDYRNLRADYERARDGNAELKDGFYSRRAYFDNSHDAMTDVWHFSRVTGDERHGHATPKPVAMMERIMMSSLPRGGLAFEPFGGSGSTLMGAENTGRICYAMELQPRFVDVIVRRWQAATGNAATLEGDGRTFDAIAAEYEADETAEAV